MNFSFRLVNYSGQFRVLVAVSCLFLFGALSFVAAPQSSQSAMSADVARGVITIGISGNGLRNDYYWLYEVHTATGEVRMVKQETHKPGSQQQVKPNSDTGSTSAAPIPPVFMHSCSVSEMSETASPDGNFLIHCGAPSQIGKQKLTLTEAKTSSTLYEWKHKNWRGIDGFAWAPDSHSLAILNASEYYGKSPLELLTGLSGHPIPHNTLYLDIMDVRTGTVTEYLVRKNVLYGYGLILSWS